MPVFQVLSGSDLAYPALFIAASNSSTRDKQRADYVCDGTADNVEIQAAIDTLEAAGGGSIVLAQGTYTYSTGVVFTPMNCTSKIRFSMYGAKISYTGTGDALLVNTNQLSDVQYGERTVHTEGVHIIGTASATCGIRNKGCARASFKDTVLEDFTSTTSQKAALILDARFHYWIEENHFDGFDFKNCGNGICFISEDDSAGVSASCMNNVFTAGSIWITQNSGRGIYGVGLGATTLVQVARCVFNSVVIHPYSATNIIAFDFNSCFAAGLVLNAAAVDAFGTVTGLIAIKYALPEPIVLAGFTGYPIASITTWFSGVGKYVVTGGNPNNGAVTGFTLDSAGNMNVPTITLGDAIYDSNGKKLIDQVEAGASAVNNIVVGNSTTGNKPYITPGGSDTDTGLSIYGKGAGRVLIDGYQVYQHELFIEPRYTTGNYTNYGNHGALALGNTVACYFEFMLPSNFTSLASAEIIGIADTTETIQFDIATDFGTDTETYNGGTDSIVDQTKGTTANKIWFQSILSGLDGIAGGDVVGVKFTSNTDFLFILGLRLKFV